MGLASQSQDIAQCETVSEASTALISLSVWFDRLCLNTEPGTHMALYFPLKPEEEAVI